MPNSGKTLIIMLGIISYRTVFCSIRKIKAPQYEGVKYIPEGLFHVSDTETAVERVAERKVAALAAPPQAKNPALRDSLLFRLF